MSNQNLLEAKNEQMNVRAERLPGHKVSLHITVSPEESAQARREAIKSINKEVSFPGFRKGKAPEALVLQHYQKFIQDEWKKEVFSRSVKTALKLLNLTPYNNNGFSIPQWEEFSLEKGAIFTTTFEEALHLKLIDPKALELSVQQEPSEVTEKEIDDVIENAAKETFATWEEVTRPIQKGDQIITDYADSTNPEEVEEVTLIVDSNEIENELIELFLDKNIGDKIEHHIKGDEKDKDETFVIKKIEKKVPAVIDESFAKDQGHESLAALREHIKGMLAINKREKWVSELHAQLDEKLLAKYPIEFPESVIEKETKQLLDMAHLYVNKENATELENVRSIIKGNKAKELNLNYLLQVYANQYKLKFLPDVILLREMQDAENALRDRSVSNPEWAKNWYENKKNHAYREASGRSIRNHIIHEGTGIPLPQLTALVFESEMAKANSAEAECPSCDEGCGCEDTLLQIGQEKK